MKINAYIPSNLTGIVDLIWEHQMNVPGRYTVLPSGKVELIFPINPVKQIEAKKITLHDNPVNHCPCFLSGLHTRPIKMTFERFHTFGIQMKPVAIKALFGIPLSEIRDYYVEGSLVFDTINTMVDKLHSIDNFQERAQWFEAFLLTKIIETADLHHAIYLDRVIKKCIYNKRNGRGKSIPDMMGYSR